MSSGVLADTHRRYKEDTSVFTTWLSEAAKTSGWKPAAGKLQVSSITSPLAKIAKGSRLKGKDRKLAKEAAKIGSVESEFIWQEGSIMKYDITTKELLEQAEIVARSKKGKAKVPENVQRVLKRAIEARKRCSAWFIHTDTAQKYSRASEGHMQLLLVLEKAAQILGTRRQDRTGESSQLVEASAKKIDVLSNYFSVLNIEETVDEDDDLLTPLGLNTLATASIKLEPRPSVHTIYQLVEDEQAELSFKVFCLFEDIHILQREVRKAWKSFRSGTLTLVAATVITTVAIELVSRAEKEFIVSNPRSVRSARSYQDLALIIFNSDSLKRGVDADENMQSTDDLENTPFEEFMYLPVGCTLMQISQQHSIFEKARYPAPIMPMKFNYIGRPEILDAPHTRNLSADDKLICQLIQDFNLMENFRKVEASYNSRFKTSELRMKLLPEFDDIFTDSIGPVWKEGNVTLCSVFATRVLLDILDICPDFDGRRLLYDEGHRQHELFEFYIDEGALDNRSGFRWLTKDQHLVLEIYNRIKMQMIDPTFADFKERMLQEACNKLMKVNASDVAADCPEQIINQIPSGSHKSVAHGTPEPDNQIEGNPEENAKKLEVGPVKPDPDPVLYMNKNPLFCGTLLLSQMVSTEAAGIALANHHLSIFAVAHLYNALRKLKHVDIVWPDMERVIELHAGPLFADDIPSTPEEMRARIFFRLGADRTLTRLNTDRRIVEKKYLSMSPTSQLLLQFFRSSQPLEKTIYQLQDNAQQRRLARTRDVKVEQRQHAESFTLVSQRVFMGQLEELATAAIEETEVPYLGLTKLCIHYLQYLREALEARGYPTSRISNIDDSNDMGLIFMVADILHQNNIVMSKSKKGATCKQMELAAVEFRRMWDYLNSDSFKENRPLYFPDRDAAHDKARSRDKGYARGW